MSGLSGKRRRRLSAPGDERGAVLVVVAIWLPVLIGFSMLVIDVGNWFEHKRHLQLQADAAALAGANQIRIPCTDSDVDAMAQTYGGVAPTGTRYNEQVGGTPLSRVHYRLNKATFHDQASPVDTTVNTSPPCSAGMVDVKLTETGLPWFFKLAGVPYINAHARVSIRAVDQSASSLPVGVPDVNPQSAEATFVDEATGTVLGSTRLTRNGVSGGLSIWDNAATPLRVPITAQNIGVRVALSGTGSATCGQPLVDCYATGTTSQPLYIRGWTGAGTATPGAPLVRDATLFAGSCSDAYFSAGSACTVGVQAKVDFGTATPVDTLGATVTATAGGTRVGLTYDATTGYWRSPATLPVGAGTGAVPVSLAWEQTKGTLNGNECKTGNGNKCTGTLGLVQRAFGGSSGNAGPVKLLQVGENGTWGANSFERCSAVLASCSRDLVVRMGIQGNLADAQSVNDPVVALRVVGGSQNQSLDCDPGVAQLKEELATGCRPQYGINGGTTTCPNSPSTLWGTAQPWRCVALQTGGAVNQVPAGMNARILGSEKPSSCTAPNRWSSFPNFAPGDPRIVQVFLTPYGTFSGSGSTTVPVTNFATFYVTGWTGQGQGFPNPCQGNGDDPVPNNDAGYIVGHFIKYINHLNDGSAGSQPCDLASTALGSCIAVLTE